MSTETAHRPPRRAIGALLVLAASGLLAVLSLAPPATPHILSSDVARLRLNPNTATAAELELLPRIGPALAEAIIACRQSAPVQPAFRTADDLQRVTRIGPVTVERLRPHLVFTDTIARKDPWREDE